MDNVISLPRRQRKAQEADILELKIQMAAVQAKLNIVMWGIGFLIMNQVLFYFAGK